MTELLKPCPFCGDEAELQWDGEGPDQNHFSEDWSVACVHCGASQMVDLTTSAKAVSAWNTRRDHDATVRENDETITHLRNALERIATPKAFYVATSDINPEAYARMIYAQAILDGLTLERAEQKTEYETHQRYPLRG